MSRAGKRGGTSSKCDENDSREWTRRKVEKPLQKRKKSLECQNHTGGKIKGRVSGTTRLYMQQVDEWMRPGINIT